MPSTYSIRKRPPTVEKKDFYISYFCIKTAAGPFEPSISSDEEDELVEFVVMDVVVKAHRASQARRTAQYMLPAVAEEVGMNASFLNISVEPMDTRVTNLFERAEKLMAARKKILKPAEEEEVPDAEGKEPDSPDSDPPKPAGSE